VAPDVIYPRAVESTTAGRLALVGSGEYLPVMHDIEAWLLQDRPARYVQLATAAAPEGDRSLGRWHELGAAAAARLGVEQVIVDVRTRADADDPAHAAAIAGAGLIYLSGGNPGYLARALRGTAVWSAILAEWRSGASLAGCSAGAMALGGYVPDIRHPKQGGTDGLAVVPEVRVLPHFDRYSRMIPDFVMRPLITPDHVVVGIDEDTALVAEGTGEDGRWEFRSRGRQSAWTIEHDRKHRVNAPLRLAVDA
jgi:cyanophycinase-like exopeptidase